MVTHIILRIEKSRVRFPPGAELFSLLYPVRSVPRGGATLLIFQYKMLSCAASGETSLLFTVREKKITRDFEASVKLRTLPSRRKEKNRGC